VIGVTGNIACGKSAVVAALESLGAAAIDADAVYHELIKPGAPLWRTLVDRYGQEIVRDDGSIDRGRLGEIVFASSAALAELDRLTHPTVVAAIRNQLKSIAQPVVVIDAVKLIESGLDADCDHVWVVTCEQQQQIDRLMRRNDLSETEARRRVLAQPAIGPKLARADVVIDNSGALADTRRQVEGAWRAASEAMSNNRTGATRRSAVRSDRGCNAAGLTSAPDR
jgi:dephospho-CoA kinase